MRQWWRYGVARLAIVVVLLAFVLVGRYANPAGDDFGYANVYRAAGWWGAQVQYYQTWTGRFTATLWQTSVPAVFGLFGWYKVWPAVLLAASAGALWLALGVWVWGRPWARPALWPALGLLAVYLVSMPRALEGFYWFASAWTYQMGNVLMLVTLALVAGRPAAGRGARLARDAGAALAAFFAVGSNEVAMVVLTGVLGLGWVVCAARRDPRRTGWLVALAAAAAATAVVLAAPGNAARLQEYPARLPLAFAGVVGTVYAVRQAVAWLTIPAVVAGAWLWLAATAARRAPARRAPPSGWLLVLLPLGGAGILAAACALPYAATGKPPEPRTANALYWWLLVGGAWYVQWLAAAVRARRPRRPAVAPAVARLLAQPLLAVGLLLVPGSYLHECLRDLFVEGPAFEQEYRERLRLIAAQRAEGARELVLPQFAHRPHTVCYVDISALSPNYGVNRAWAGYFGVEAVRGTLNPPPEPGPQGQ